MKGEAKINRTLVEEMKARPSDKPRSYEVGQILYVVSGADARIVPIQVCEEVRRRTVGGEEVTYLVRIDAEPTTHDLKQLKTAIHLSVEDASATLRANFEAFLQQQVAWTLETQRAWYSLAKPVPLTSVPAARPAISDGERAVEDLLARATDPTR